MLLVGGLQFDEASVQVHVGGRTLTVDVTGDRAPQFIHVIGPQRPSDADFYQEVERTVPAMA